MPSSLQCLSIPWCLCLLTRLFYHGNELRCRGMTPRGVPHGVPVRLCETESCARCTDEIERTGGQWSTPPKQGIKASEIVVDTTTLQD